LFRELREIVEQKTAAHLIPDLVEIQTTPEERNQPAIAN